MLTAGVLRKTKTEQTPGTRLAASPRGRSFLTFLMVMGPGLIVMEADNDAGAVSTYTQAGAQYGTHLMWVLLLLLPITYFVQEMVARLTQRATIVTTVGAYRVFRR